MRHRIGLIQLNNYNNITKIDRIDELVESFSSKSKLSTSISASIQECIQIDTRVLSILSNIALKSVNEQSIKISIK